MILDNLSAPRASDVLLFALHPSHGAFIFPPKSAASLNRIEPGWKVLRSLALIRSFALKGRRFEGWEEIC